APAGRVLASGDADGSIKLWDPATGKELTSLAAFTDGGGAGSLTFPPDGRVLAAGSDNGTVKIWNLAAGDSKPGQPKSSVEPESQVKLNKNVRVLDAHTLQSGDILPLCISHEFNQFAR